MIKKLITSRIFSFILGAILFSGVTVFAYSISSKDIAFTPSNPEWQVTNVEEAMNSLYTSLDSKTSLTYVGTIKGGFNQTTSTNTTKLTKILTSGKYLVIISISATDSSKVADITNTTSSLGTLSGCNESSNLFYSTYGNYYNTSTTYGNQWLNVKTCTLNTDATVSYTRTVSDDNNIVLSFFKLN